jgi:hypothetical protein
MTTHFPDNVLNALKEAMVKVFWTKNHLRQVLNQSGVPQDLIGARDWDGYKYHIVDPILNTLNTKQEGLGPLRRLLAETLNYSDGSHLLAFQDGAKLKREADQHLERLRLLVEKHDKGFKEGQEEQARRREELEKERARSSFFAALSGLRERFLKLYSESNAQKRGYGFEKLLYELFQLFELSPVGSFKLVGEQIDGAFILDGDDFLLEARWRKEPAILDDLRDLDAAVASKLDNTRGLFISMQGFSDEAIESYPKGSRPKLICMDGVDLMAVFEGQIDLSDLIRRKRSIASQRAKIYVPVREILKGEI